MSLILAALALSLAMVLTSCGDSGGGGGGITVQNTEGRLVISGLGAFNGDRVFAAWPESTPPLFAGARAGMTGSRNDPTIQSVLIADGTATLYLWGLDLAGERLISFTGPAPAYFMVTIVSSNIRYSDLAAIEDYIASGPRPAFLRRLGHIPSISTTGLQLSGTFQAAL